MATKRQIETLNIIKNYFNNYGYAPTTQEIAIQLGIKSRGVVYRYLEALQAENLIQLTPNKKRNITLTTNDNNFDNNELTIIGNIAAGQPIEAINTHDTLNITNLFLQPGRYALRVKGDSMIDDGIFDGDIVVCQQSDCANDNQVVVALVDNDFATLKRIKFKEPNKILLEPANKSHQVQEYHAERVKIQGVLIGLLRLNY